MIVTLTKLAVNAIKKVDNPEHPIGAPLADTLEDQIEKAKPPKGNGDSQAEKDGWM
ncbi:MAG: hypothetical protein ABJL54_16020 [Halioglobus sp.]